MSIVNMNSKIYHFSIGTGLQILERYIKPGIVYWVKMGLSSICNPDPITKIIIKISMSNI